MKNENVCLKKKLEEVEAALSAQETELKKVKSKAEYYEDKSTSMKLFTTVKVRAEMLKEYTKGKFFAWDPEDAFSTWEQMKLLYSDSEVGEAQQAGELAGSSLIDLVDLRMW